MSVVIIDYGMGNVASVQKSLNFLNIESLISNDKAEIEKAKFILLPGVGSFKQGMENIKKAGLIDILNQEVQERKKPFLGICLGMQLIATKGTEPEDCDGLGWINGNVIKMEENVNRIPHLGWNNIQVNQSEILKDLDEKDFYFIHSYHFKVNDPKQIAALVNYGQDYVAAVQHENIFATQFHPEKSQQAGLDLLTNFFNHYA